MNNHPKSAQVILSMEDYEHLLSNQKEPHDEGLYSWMISMLRSGEASEMTGNELADFLARKPNEYGKGYGPPEATKPQ